jgi:hypothetical protein
MWVPARVRSTEYDIRRPRVQQHWQGPVSTAQKKSKEGKELNLGVDVAVAACKSLFSMVGNPLAEDWVLKKRLAFVLWTDNDCDGPSKEWEDVICSGRQLFLRCSGHTSEECFIQLPGTNSYI